VWFRVFRVFRGGPRLEERTGDWIGGEGTAEKTE
jgi:hypothetical protein